MLNIDVADIEALFRKLSDDERNRVGMLIPIVIDCLRQEAKNAGRDFDVMYDAGDILPNVVYQVVTDIIGRVINASTTSEAMTQISQSGLGYSAQGTYLSPGGGVFIKRSELARLGIRKQKVGSIDLWP